MNKPFVGDIRGVLIPVGPEKLLLPNATVAEIISYREPEPLDDAAPNWMLGDIDWRQRLVPVVAFENLFGGNYKPYTRGRIAVCYSLLEDRDRPYLGVVSDGIPHLVRVREEDIEVLPFTEADQDLPLLARLRLKDEEAVIPDLARLTEIVAT